LWTQSRQFRTLLGVLVFAIFCPDVLADDAAERQAAMAVENVRLAEKACGYDLTIVARNLIALDAADDNEPFANDRAVLANLWRQTFACNPVFAGENCFAARWQMCQRAYAEYGPDGIRLRGLIKPIVKK